MTNEQPIGQGEKLVAHVDPELADLIPGFLENRWKDVTAILEALARSDFETVRVLGHSMKGSGAGYGFDAITEIGAALERAAKQGDATGVRTSLEDLSRYLARVEVIYD